MISSRTYSRVLVDAGPLAALCDPNDQYHRECVDTLGVIAPPLLTSWLVIAEAAHLLRKSPPSIHQLLSAPAAALYRILSLAEEDLPRILALVRKYHKLGQQVADISLVYLAEREGLDTVFTLDRRDFSVYRAAGKAFQVLPDISRRPRR